jgi:hypothetical protein
MNQKNIYRIVDANLNRAREGIRVVEDIARLYFNDDKLSKKLKLFRHRITRIAQESFDSNMLLLSRDSQGDVGAKGMGKSERKREDLKSIIQANLRRSCEGLRVLEEFGKLIREESAEKYKKLRFKLYSLEKQMGQRIKRI